MFPTPVSLQAIGQARERQEKTVGKYVVGKVGWEGEGMVSAKVRPKRSDELIGVETRHKYKPLQLLTLRLSYGGSHEKHTHLVQQRTDT